MPKLNVASKPLENLELERWKVENVDASVVNFWPELFLFRQLYSSSLLDSALLVVVEKAAALFLRSPLFGAKNSGLEAETGNIFFN